MRKEFIILIPAYQPKESFIDLIHSIENENVDHIIVVDDGSGEEYKNIFDSLKKNITLLVHSINRGKGAALKTGFQYISSHYSSYVVVTMDCDGQHKIKDAKKLYDYNLNHEDEFVLGSRKLDCNVPLRSKLGNGITRKIFSFVTRVKVYDTQTGLRSFSNELMSLMLNIDGSRFEYEINVLLECTKRNILIHEIWIETIYYNNNSGSHFHAFKDSYRIYKQIITYALKKRT